MSHCFPTRYGLQYKTVFAMMENLLAQPQQLKGDNLPEIPNLLRYFLYNKFSIGVFFYLN